MTAPEEPHPLTSPRSLCLNTSRSSTGRPLCRICQSETGVMVRPCACAGTMGDIHQNCLNVWITHSGSPNCEICKEAYARSSKQFRPIREWSKPRISLRIFLILVSMACLITSFLNIYFISVERKFFERVFVRGFPPRGGDVARMGLFPFPPSLVSKWLQHQFLVLAGILAILILFLCTAIYNKIIGYFVRQRRVQFVNNPNHCKQKEMNGL